MAVIFMKKKMMTPSRKLPYTAEASLTVFINEEEVAKSPYINFLMLCNDLLGFVKVLLFCSLLTLLRPPKRFQILLLNECM